MNSCKLSPSHGLQSFMNCFSLGPWHSPAGTGCSSMGPPLNKALDCVDTTGELTLLMALLQPVKDPTHK